MNIAQLIQSRDSGIVTCTSAMSVAEAARLLAEKRIGALPVVDGDKVLGIFSERDLLYCVARDGAAALDQRVGDVMTSPAITVSQETEVIEALSLMTRRRIRHLPVLEGEAMIALVSIGDLVKMRVEAAEREAEAMRAYIQTA